MIHSISKSSKAIFNEVAIADFGPFQIAVPTRTTLVTRRFFSAQVPVSQRQYQSQGWLIYNGRVVAAIEAITFGSIFAEESPFRPIQRIAPAIPMDFEVKSAQPLPAQLSAQTTFACELPDSAFPIHSIFCQVQPRFVKVYPFREIMTLSTQVNQLLADEASFIETNRHQLKQVPFYKTHFGL